MAKKINERTIQITPDWFSMFEYAKRICEAHIPKDEGLETVLEMLSYGQRLEGQCPYNDEMESAVEQQGQALAKLEAKALAEIQKLAEENDPALDAISKAAKTYAAKEAK